MVVTIKFEGYNVSFKKEQRNSNKAAGLSLATKMQLFATFFYAS